MKLSVTIPLKAIGLNNSYSLTSKGKFARRYKLPHTKEFEDRFSHKLTKFSKEIKEFNERYCEKTHYLLIKIEFHGKMFTQKKTINKNSGDWDGLIKIAQDCLFKELIADDSQIMNGSVKKVNSKDDKIIFNLYLKPLFEIM